MYLGGAAACFVCVSHCMFHSFQTDDSENIKHTRITAQLTQQRRAIDASCESLSHTAKPEKKTKHFVLLVHFYSPHNSFRLFAIWQCACAYGIAYIYRDDQVESRNVPISKNLLRQRFFCVDIATSTVHFRLETNWKCEKFEYFFLLARFQSRIFDYGISFGD